MKASAYMPAHPPLALVSWACRAKSSMRKLKENCTGKGKEGKRHSAFREVHHKLVCW